MLLRVQRVGICGTDLHIFAGRQPYLQYPRVMGHELSAIVAQCAARQPAGGRRHGLRHALPVVRPLRRLPAGRTNCCVELQVLGVHRDGAFTEYLSVPERFVHKAEGVTLDQAAMIEFLPSVRTRSGARRCAQGSACWWSAPARSAWARSSSPGCAARRWSRSIRAPDRLAFASRVLGTEASVAVGADDVDQLAALSGNEFYDVVFDATGNPAAMERGFRFVAHAGTYVLISVVSADITFNDPEFHKRETTLLGSRNATAEDFETVVATMREGRIPAALNTHRMALADVPEKFPALLDPGRAW